MDLPKEWAIILLTYQEEEYWRRQGEAAIRMEMERRLAEYSERKQRQRVDAKTAEVRRAAEHARRLKEAADDALKRAEAARKRAEEAAQPLLRPVLTGLWNKTNRTNAEENTERVAHGLPRKQEARQRRLKILRVPEKLPWRFRTQ